MRKIALAIVALAIFAAAFGPPTSDATAEPASAEYAIKAAFLYNVCKFVEWPTTTWKGAADPFYLVILGRDPFGDTLNAIANKEVKGRKIVIRRVSAVENVGQCHALFVSDSESERFRDILERFRNRSVLLVGDTSKFASQGGMVSLVKRENKIQLEINAKAASQSGLIISSHLLRLATIVGGE